MNRETIDAARAPRPDDRPVLTRRAAALARVARGTEEVETFPAVVFSLGDERYAIDARVVRQVAVLREITPLPGAKKPKYGVTQWRGNVLTIFDLREVLGAHGRGIPDLSRIIVVEGVHHTFGFLVDISLSLIELDQASVRRLPGDETSRTLIRGIRADGLLVIDVAALLNEYGTNTSNLSVTGKEVV